MAYSIAFIQTIYLTLPRSLNKFENIENKLNLDTSNYLISSKIIWSYRGSVVRALAAGTISNQHAVWLRLNLLNSLLNERANADNWLHAILICQAF